jgi:uncharacterized membrane protein YfcA
VLTPWLLLVSIWLVPLTPKEVLALAMAAVLINSSFSWQANAKASGYSLSMLPLLSIACAGGALTAALLVIYLGGLTITGTMIALAQLSLAGLLAGRIKIQSTLDGPFGLMSGAFSVVAGIGGGTLVMPYLLMRDGMKPGVAAGISASCGVSIGLASVGAFFLAGAYPASGVVAGFLAAVACGALVASKFGASVAKTLSKEKVRYWLIALLCLSGAVGLTKWADMPLTFGG